MFGTFTVTQCEYEDGPQGLSYCCYTWTKKEEKALFYKLNLNPSHKKMKTPYTNLSLRTCPQVSQMIVPLHHEAISAGNNYINY